MLVLSGHAFLTVHRGGASAVDEKDTARLTCIKGVGGRMAERLVIEWKPCAKWQPNLLNGAAVADPSSTVIEDVVRALT